MTVCFIFARFERTLAGYFLTELGNCSLVVENGEGSNFPRDSRGFKFGNSNGRDGVAQLRSVGWGSLPKNLRARALERLIEVSRVRSIKLCLGRLGTDGVEINS